jgi:hypothetical protein
MRGFAVERIGDGVGFAIGALTAGAGEGMRIGAGGGAGAGAGSGEGMRPAMTGGGGATVRPTARGADEAAVIGTGGSAPRDLPSMSFAPPRLSESSAVSNDHSPHTGGSRNPMAASDTPSVFGAPDVPGA